MISEKIKFFLKKVPGYRSGNKINEVFASIYYLIPIILLGLNIVLDEFKLKDLKIGISMFIFPFIVFAMLDGANKN